MNPIEELVKQLSEYYYTKLILLICETFAVTIGAINYQSLQKLKVFFWYLFADLCLFVISISLDCFKIISLKQIHTLNYSINLSISLVEIVVYYSFYYPIIKQKKYIRIYASTILIIGLMIIISKLESENPLSFFSESHLISSISFLLIFPLSVYNIINLINNYQNEFLHKEPIFWITIGALYYSAISTPYYYFRGFFGIEPGFKVILDSALFYTPFTINIICISISFICKKQAKK